MTNKLLCTKQWFHCKIGTNHCNSEWKAKSSYFKENPWSYIFLLFTFFIFWWSFCFASIIISWCRHHVISPVNKVMLYAYTKKIISSGLQKHGSRNGLYSVSPSVYTSWFFKMGKITMEIGKSRPTVKIRTIPGSRGTNIMSSHHPPSLFVLTAANMNVQHSPLQSVSGIPWCHSPHTGSCWQSGKRTGCQTPHPLVWSQTHHWRFGRQSPIRTVH